MPAVILVGSEMMIAIISGDTTAVSSVLKQATDQLSSSLMTILTDLTVLLSIAAQAASAIVPPNSLKKFLVPVATAISCLLTLA